MAYMINWFGCGLVFTYCGTQRRREENCHGHRGHGHGHTAMHVHVHHVLFDAHLARPRPLQLLQCIKILVITKFYHHDSNNYVNLVVSFVI